MVSNEVLKIREAIRRAVMTATDEDKQLLRKCYNDYFIVNRNEIARVQKEVNDWM